MEINGLSGQSFGALKLTLQAADLLERRSKAKRSPELILEKMRQQEKSPVNILIDATDRNNLIGTLSYKNKGTDYRKQYSESLIMELWDNYMGFINKMIKRADEVKLHIEGIA